MFHYVCPVFDFVQRFFLGHLHTYHCLTDAGFFGHQSKESLLTIQEKPSLNLTKLGHQTMQRTSLDTKYIVIVDHSLVRILVLVAYWCS